MCRRIAAVVVTRDRPRLLSEVITALQMQTRACDAIYIVDNASGLQTQDLLAAIPHVIVIRSAANLGGTGGFVLGMQQAVDAGHDWIWLLDDDAVPRLQALAALEQALHALPATTGAVCGTVREFDDVATMHRRTFTRILGLERSLPRSAYAGGPVAIDTGSFVGFMVSVAAIDKAGLPDPTFFLAYDDTDYSLRLKQAGFTVWLVPASIVDHKRTVEGRMRATDFGRKHYFNIRNRIVVKKRHALFGTLAAGAGCCFGVGLWLRSQGGFRWNTFRILMRALGDGCQARLGDYPYGE